MRRKYDDHSQRHIERRRIQRRQVSSSECGCYSREDSDNEWENLTDESIDKEDDDDNSTNDDFSDDVKIDQLEAIGDVRTHIFDSQRKVCAALEGGYHTTTTEYILFKYQYDVVIPTSLSNSQIDWNATNFMLTSLAASTTKATQEFLLDLYIRPFCKILHQSEIDSVLLESNQFSSFAPLVRGVDLGDSRALNEVPCSSFYNDSTCWRMESENSVHFDDNQTIQEVMSIKFHSDTKIRSNILQTISDSFDDGKLMEYFKQVIMKENDYHAIAPVSLRFIVGTSSRVTVHGERQPQEPSTLEAMNTNNDSSLRLRGDIIALITILAMCLIATATFLYIKKRRSSNETVASKRSDVNSILDSAASSDTKSSDMSTGSRAIQEIFNSLFFCIPPILPQKFNKTSKQNMIYADDVGYDYCITNIAAITTNDAKSHNITQMFASPDDDDEDFFGIEHVCSQDTKNAMAANDGCSYFVRSIQEAALGDEISSLNTTLGDSTISDFPMFQDGKDETNDFVIL
jgi:hypothetical protein